MRKKGQFSFQRVLLNKRGRHEGQQKSLLQARSTVDTKISGRTFKEKQDLHGSKLFPPQICINYRGKNNDFTVETWWTPGSLVIRVSAPSNGTQCHVPPDTRH